MPTPADMPHRPETRLYLVTPPIAPPEFPQLLDEVIAAGDVASVLIFGDARDPRAYQSLARPLVSLVQARGAAALLRGDTQLVGRTGADGFHADADHAALEAALGDLKPDRIVGAGNLRSRHDAMTAGEAGADYVFFGQLGQSDEERGNAVELLIERAEWWQPIFEIPCVVHAPTLDAAGPLARAGADFVALGNALWQETDPVAAIAGVRRTIARIFAGRAA